MTLLDLCKENKDYIFSYTIDLKHHLCLMAQTTITNNCGEEVECAMEYNDKFELEKITHFVVELWENDEAIEEFPFDKNENLTECITFFKRYIDFEE